MSSNISTVVDKSVPLSFDEFPLPSRDAWRKEAEATLAGVPFEKKLVTKTWEAIDIQPIYSREDLEKLPHLGSLPGEQPYVRGTRSVNSWDVAQEIPYGSPSDYNQALRNDLERGQTAMNITLDEATRHGIDPDVARAGQASMCGVSIATSKDFDRILDGIDIERVPLFLQAGSAALPVFALLISHFQRTGKDPARLRGAFEYDPLGELVTDGTLPDSIAASFEEMAQITKWAVKKAPAFGTIAVKTHVYHDAGATAVQELAYALATGVEYLRQMESHGLTVGETSPRMRFAFSIGTDFFMAIAKFRAARLLWSKIISKCGADREAAKMRIHARTSIWNKTGLDPYVNILRGTTEAFAAVAGGCESMHVGAFDEVVRPPDEFSRRIARNTQLILRDECHFDQVIDPAGGSYYVETLTHGLARKAWAQFQEIEKSGGMTKALLSGVPQQQVTATGAKRAAAIAQRRESVIGVNVYANPREKPLDTRDLEMSARQQQRAAYATDFRTSSDQSQVAHTRVLDLLGMMLAASPGRLVELAISAAMEGATLGELSRTLRARDRELPKAPRLRTTRASEPFEKLRAAVGAAGRPKVFLANMGPLRQFKARADFSTSFFQAGGFDVLENRGFKSIGLAMEAAVVSGASIFVICSTDETYPELVPPLAGAIKAAQPKAIVIVAGYPKDHIEAFKAAGVDDFIHVRANCHDMLLGLAAKLGIQL